MVALPASARLSNARIPAFPPATLAPSTTILALAAVEYAEKSATLRRRGDGCWRWPAVVVGGPEKLPLKMRTLSSSMVIVGILGRGVVVEQQLCPGADADRRAAGAGVAEELQTEIVRVIRSKVDHGRGRRWTGC